MEFKDLPFEPHRIGDGVHAKVFFDNGFGASVVRFTIMGTSGSYGAEQGLYELAVLEGNKDSWTLCYDTPLTSDVLGHLTENDVTELLKKIEKLPKAEM